MKIAATSSIRKNHPSLLEIPAEPGFVDLTIVLNTEWDPAFKHRFRQLRYVVVGSLEEADNLLRAIGHVDKTPPSPDRNRRAHLRVGLKNLTGEVLPA